jgi:hypothetical protein
MARSHAKARTPTLDKLVDPGRSQPSERFGNENDDEGEFLELVLEQPFRLSTDCDSRESATWDRRCRQQIPAWSDPT